MSKIHTVVVDCFPPHMSEDAVAAYLKYNKLLVQALRDFDVGQSNVFDRNKVLIDKEYIFVNSA